jgi:hypothetical protein
MTATLQGLANGRGLCNRLAGGSAADCHCRLPNLGGWLECPPEARGIRPARRLALIGGGYTGDICDSCGSARMVRSGTCATCLDCGTASGGCS